MMMHGSQTISPINVQLFRKCRRSVKIIGAQRSTAIQQRVNQLSGNTIQLTNFPLLTCFTGVYFGVVQIGRLRIKASPHLKINVKMREKYFYIQSIHLIFHS